jgi:hypothetical protein
MRKRLAGKAEAYGSGDDEKAGEIMHEDVS